MLEYRTVTFGPNTWIIIDQTLEAYLLLSEQIVCMRDYHNSSMQVDWEQCELRNYLNNTFLESFTLDEKNQIIETVNDNTGNSWYGVYKGKQTLDRVFLPSIEDVVQGYFGDSLHLLENPTQGQRYWFQRKDKNNIRRQSTYLNSSWWWWLRTPGKSKKYASYVHGDGNIGIQGNGIGKRNVTVIHPVTKTSEGGVRPMMWIKKGGLRDE